MADLYNHYKGVDPDSITSAAESLKKKVESSRSKLNSFKTSLSDSVWKASAKETLFKAFETLDSEVYEDILNKLGKAEEVAGYITKYNNAKSKAEGYLDNLNNSTKDTPQSSIDTWRSNLTDQEDLMRQYVSSINNLL
jgi:hypothetical protein